MFDKRMNVFGLQLLVMLFKNIFEEKLLLMEAFHQIINCDVF